MLSEDQDPLLKSYCIYTVILIGTPKPFLPLLNLHFVIVLGYVFCLISCSCWFLFVFSITFLLACLAV